MHPSEPADVDEGHRALPPLAATHATEPTRGRVDGTLPLDSSAPGYSSIPVSQHPSLTRRHEQFRPRADIDRFPDRRFHDDKGGDTLNS